MTAEQAAVITDFLTSQLTMESDATARILAAVPDDKADYKPSEKNMSAGELALHIVLAEIWFLEGVLKGEFVWPGGEPPNLKPSEATALYKEKIPALIEQVKQLPGEHLAKTAQFHTFVLPLAQYISFATVHSIHHRGQLSVYLRPIGAKVPSIYGGSADEPVGAAQSA